MLHLSRHSFNFDIDRLTANPCSITTFQHKNRPIKLSFGSFWNQVSEWKADRTQICVAPFCYRRTALYLFFVKQWHHSAGFASSALTTELIVALSKTGSMICFFLYLQCFHMDKKNLNCFYLSRNCFWNYMCFGFVWK